MRKRAMGKEFTIRESDGVKVHHATKIDGVRVHLEKERWRENSS